MAEDIPMRFRRNELSENGVADPSNSDKSSSDIEPVFLTMIILLSVILAAVVLLIFYRVSNHFFKVKRRPRYPHAFASRKSSDYSLKPMMELIAERSASYGNRLKPSVTQHDQIRRSASAGADSRYGLKFMSSSNSNSANSSGQSTGQTMNSYGYSTMYARCPHAQTENSMIVTRAALESHVYNTAPRSRAQSVASWTYMPRRPSRSHYTPDNVCRKSVSDACSVLSTAMLSPPAEYRGAIKCSTPSYLSQDHRVFRDDSIDQDLEEDTYLQMGGASDNLTDDGLRSSQSCDLDETVDGYENMSSSWASIGQETGLYKDEPVFADPLRQSHNHFVPGRDIIEEARVAYPHLSSATSQFYRYNVHRSFSADLATTSQRMQLPGSGRSPLTVRQMKRRNFERSGGILPPSTTNQPMVCKSLEDLQSQHNRTLPPPLPKRSDEIQRELFTLNEQHYSRTIPTITSEQFQVPKNITEGSKYEKQQHHLQVKRAIPHSHSLEIPAALNNQLQGVFPPSKSHPVSPNPNNHHHERPTNNRNLLITTSELRHCNQPEGSSSLWSTCPRYIAMPVKSPKFVPIRQPKTPVVPATTSNPAPPTSSHAKSWLESLRQPENHDPCQARSSNQGDTQSDAELPWYSESSA